MIPKAQKNELLILYVVLKSTVTAESLSQLLGVPKRTIKEQIRHLNAALEEHFALKNLISSNYKGEITFQLEHKEAGLALFFQLKLFYMKQSVDFLIVTKLLTKPAITANKLAQDLFISRSYLSRKIKLLNAQFKDLDISIQSKNGCVSLAGDEIIVRLFGFFLLADAYHALEWPFETFSRQELNSRIPPQILETSAKRSEAKNSLLRYLFSIMQTRIAGGHFIPPAENPALVELVEMIDSVYDISALLFTETKKTAIPLAHQANEGLYIDFFCHIFASEFVPPTVITELGKKFAVSQNKYTRLALQLIRQVEAAARIKISAETIDTFLYFLTLQIAYYEVMDHKIAPMERFLFQSPNLSTAFNTFLSHQIAEQLDQFIAHEALEYLNDERARMTLRNLLSILLEVENRSKTYIYIQIYKEFSTKFMINHMIASVFNAENVVITDDFRKADLVITDSLEQADRTQRNIYFFDSLKNHDQWKEILQAIQAIQLKKMLVE